MAEAKSAAWVEAYDGLAEEISRWIAAAIRRNKDLPFAGGHDECKRVGPDDTLHAARRRRPAGKGAESTSAMA